MATRKPDPSEPKQIEFDFAAPDTYRENLPQFDRILLLRPPQLADADRYFRPFAEALQPYQHVVFLSVQGADQMRWVPHHGIEKLLLRSAASCSFLRPSYFMQNLLGDLWPDLAERGQLYVPAGSARFNLIDVSDIGRAAASLLAESPDAKESAFELTGPENLTFAEMARIVSEETGRQIEYRSPNPFRFIRERHRRGASWGQAFVITVLHVLPRLQRREPPITSDLEKLIGGEPNPFRQFVRREIAPRFG